MDSHVSQHILDAREQMDHIRSKQMSYVSYSEAVCICHFPWVDKLSWKGTQKNL